MIFFIVIFPTFYSLKKLRPFLIFIKTWQIDLEDEITTDKLNSLFKLINKTTNEVVYLKGLKLYASTIFFYILFFIFSIVGVLFFIIALCINNFIPSIVYTLFLFLTNFFIYSPFFIIILSFHLNYLFLRKNIDFFSHHIKNIERVLLGFNITKLSWILAIIGIIIYCILYNVPMIFKY